MNKKNLLFLILGLLVVISLGVTIYWAIETGKISFRAAENLATINLLPPSGNFTVGQEFDVAIQVNTDNIPTYAASAVLTFDNNLLEVVDQNATKSGIQIMPGSFYPTELTNEVNGNQIIFEGGASTGSGAQVIGTGILATIKFKAKGAGNASVESGNSMVLDTTAQNILNQPTNASYVIKVSESPTPAPTVNLKVNGQKEVTIKAGNYITISWSATNATSCLGSGSWTDSKPLSGEARLGPFSEPKVYKLICSNSAGNAFATATVHIEGQPAPVLPAVDLKVNNADGPITINYNAGATLSWNSTNAANCVASNGWSGDKATAGEEATGNLTDSKTYTLTCYRDDANTIDSVTVNITDRPQASPGPSDGSQVVSQAEPPSSESETPEAAEEGQTVTQAPTSPTTSTSTQPSTQTTEIYKGGVVRPWTLWFFYALIPLSLTAGIVWFYLRQKRAKKIKSSVSDLSNMPNPPGDWPK